MARSDFTTIYPAKGRLSFDGGLNISVDQQLLADNESPSCLNVVFDKGSVETRGGSTNINTTSVGTFPGEGLYTRHDNTGAQTMCAWWNGTMYTLGTTTFTTVPSAQSIYTAGGRVASTEYENYIFFCNGEHIPYKYNGTDFTRHGIYPPNSAPTFSTVASAGNLVGDYQWKVTFVNSALVESDVSSAMATYAATAGGESVTINVPIAPQSFGVSTRRIYRTEAGGTTFKRVATLSDNTTTTYADNIADGSLGTAAPTDQGVPPKYSAIIHFKDRLFCTNPTYKNYVWYSELGDPYVFKATSFIKMGDNTSDLLTGFCVYADALVCLCVKGQYIIYMPDTTPGNWVLIKATSPFGSRSRFGHFAYNNKVMFPALQNSKLVGFAALSGTAIEPDVTFTTISNLADELKSSKISDDVYDINEAVLDKITSYVFRDKAYISVPYGTLQTTNNRIYVWDFSINDLNKKQEGSWVPWSGINAEQFCEYNGKLYCQDASTGHILEMNTDTYNDNDVPIDSFYWTKEFSGFQGHENFHKDFRAVHILHELSGDYFMNFYIKVDSDLGSGDRQHINLLGSGSYWGTMVWGVDTWGGGNSILDTKLYLGQTRGKRIQFGFSNQNTADQKFKIVGLKYNYNNKGMR
jgi:hypothetical protein